MAEKVFYDGEEYVLPPGITKDDIWISKVRSGFDPKVMQWRNKQGTLAREADARASRLTPDFAIGGYLEGTQVIDTPWSNAWANYEHVIAGISTEDLTKITLGLSEQADPLPRIIENEMRQAAHFFNQEGDIAQSFLIPIELLLQEVYSTSKDEGVEKLINDIYGNEIGIDLRWHLYEIALCAAIYGQAFPLEIWDTDGKSPIPENIIPLMPENVRVGQRMSRENFYLTLPPPGGTWSEDDKQQLRAIDVVLDTTWEDAVNQNKAVGVNPELCRPVRWHGLSFARYVHPPLAAMFRPITTRILVEEARRATIEGFKNQIWLVQVGTPDNRGTEQEVSQMRVTLNALKGQRIGTILWNGNAAIEAVAPNALSPLMEDTLWLSITLDIMRRRGISLSVISGESPTRGAGSGDVDVDIRMLLMRLGWLRRWLLRWVAGLTRRILEIDAMNFWQRRAADKARVKTYIKPTSEESARILEEHMRPLVGIGQVSTHTLLEAAGLDWETELGYKELEEPHRDLFSPPVTFRQQAAGPSGQWKETSSPDRPPLKTEQNRLKMQLAANIVTAQEGEEAGRLFRQYLSMFWALAVLDAEVAVAQLRDHMREYMLAVARIGYSEHGGKGEIDESWIDQGYSRLIAYAGGLQRDWDILSPARKQWRLGLYAQEGLRIGYVLGVQQVAKEEYAASHWQRILHPERSDAGPCVACQEDSFHIHSITEPFFEFHPNGVCTAQALAFFRPDTGEAAFTEVDMPLPGAVEET